ncbi:MAG: aconitase X, partial [Candidatus Thermoplasmatota archaeon]|nr:aconitase X [Candidatus Thermoplasmatota archaeon]
KLRITVFQYVGLKEYHLTAFLMDVPAELLSMLSGEQGPTKQKASRLVIDLAVTAGATQFVRAEHAHVSGVSVITGGHGLRRFLSDLSGDPQGRVSIPTTLNSAGCDHDKMEEMGIDHPDFLEQQFEIVQSYSELGIEATLSCTPYDRGIESEEGIGSWAESNAVCFSNSYTSLVTNRESGLSALATAITGWAPLWGLHIEENRIPNILVNVECEMDDPTDWSILGDWIGKNLKPEWELPWGPMPRITGLPPATFEMRKALTASAANYGCPMLWADGLTGDAPEVTSYQGEMTFTRDELDRRYLELAPSGTVDLVVIGCPQASVGEARSTAAAVRARMELGEAIPNQRLWVFMSSHNYDLIAADGTLDILEEAGALVLRDTCPEVTPYNRSRYNHLLTNSLKAEHYLTSGLNRMPTSVADIQDCVSHAFDPELVSGDRPVLDSAKAKPMATAKSHKTGEILASGVGIPSQSSWKVSGKALVTDVPITYLGYVNRDTGVIEEPGHPLDGSPIEETILIYPKGSGSTVAPFVLMGLIYTGKGPKGIVNRDVCPLTLPAASLLDVPYAHGFDVDPTIEINTGDQVEMSLIDGKVSLKAITRASEG